MDISKQSQQAGDNATQNQIIGNNSNQTIIEKQIVNNGLTTQDWTTFTTTLTTQLTALTLQSCTQVAKEIVEERTHNFYKKLLPRIEKMEGVVGHLKDPKFQFMIRDASITAAQSSREEDLDQLAELLALHIEKGKDLKTDSGIQKAIEIANRVDSESLCALSIVATILRVRPTTGRITEGLDIMEHLFSQLLYTTLPNGDDWIDHLAVLGTIFIRTGNFNKIDKLLSNNLDGYICVGIKGQSNEYDKAVSILNEKGIPLKHFVPNKCLEGYYRLAISNTSDLKPELKPILDLYSKDSILLNTAKNNFMGLCNSHQSLKIVCDWFNNIPIWFIINSAGLALSQTNAQRVCHGYPAFIR